MTAFSLPHSTENRPVTSLGITESSPASLAPSAELSSSRIGPCFVGAPATTVTSMVHQQVGTGSVSIISCDFTLSRNAAGAHVKQRRPRR